MSFCDRDNAFMRLQFGTFKAAFQQSLLSGSRISRHRSRQSARQRPQSLCLPREDLREGRVDVHLLQLRQLRL
jgi:hypothetical protein